MMQKEKLRTIRKQKNYTQQQVADAIATDVSNYSRKENGDVKITKEEWNKLSKFLSVSLGDIYEEEVSKKNTNEDSQKITSVIPEDDLNVELIRNLLDYITLLKEENTRLKKEFKN
ncbi:helix-turn-helix transcriptional regulator [Chryseobacterium sp. c4a]|uniref:helix-turn-helix transcriptional regulator n=1 Tax=Chryseobacterium sp. c4a TaxID=1573582 RepID=UPI001E309F80|nr:helix-turn-helix transcriptional regulator [Chryseobacterium sp. c4a]